MAVQNRPSITMFSVSMAGIDGRLKPAIDTKNMLIDGRFQPAIDLYVESTCSSGNRSDGGIGQPPPSLYTEGAAPSKGSSPRVNLAKHEKQKGTEGKLIVVTSNDKAVFTLDLLEIEQKSGNGHIDGATGQDWIGINYVIDDHPMTYKRVEFKMLPEHISTFTEFTCDHVNYYDNSKDNEEQMKSSTSKKKKNHVSRDSPIQTQSANQNTSRHWDSLDSSSTSSDPESPAANPLIPDDQIALHQISAGNPGTKRKNTTINTPTSISANLPAPNDGDVDWD
ncbi:hypothetical protein KEM48_005147 [Puccinia striiformis f. sp. tritici PST-130]|nr:hypothetical protein KEM48_005147 [Puccinia striiformis f. sp. tritici PST-130]